jgi:hypothetical protein
MRTLVAFEVIPGRGGDRAKVRLTWTDSRMALREIHSAFRDTPSIIAAGPESYTYTEEIAVEDAAHLEQLKRMYGPDWLA